MRASKAATPFRTNNCIQSRACIGWAWQVQGACCMRVARAQVEAWPAICGSGPPAGPLCFSCGRLALMPHLTWAQHMA